MKEYCALNANLGLVYSQDEDVVTGVAEVILMLTEPEYKVREDHPGHPYVSSERKNLETVRFTTSWQGLRNLIDGLEVLSEDLARFEDRITIDPEVNVADRGPITIDEEANGLE